ncbi:hypothetical protein LXL04_006777 [Taraxacum kok-saghyz]
MHSSRSIQKLLIRHRTYHENEEGEFEGFYTLHSQDQLPLCPTRGYIGIPQLEFPFTYSTIVGSCDGIICLFDYNDNHISLWNPSIRRTLILPDCPRRCYSASEIGFGYDPITDDHKVVSVPGVIGEHVELAYVYSIKKNAWCAVSSPMPVYRRVSLKSRACFVSGALHWLVQLYGAREFFIMKFDLSKHVFSRVPSPEPRWTKGPTAVHGCLAVVTEQSLTENWIWVRRGDSWCVVFKLKEAEEADDLGGALQLGTDGVLVFDMVFGFQVYNPKTGAYPRLVDFNYDSFLLENCQCDESLRLLDMGTSC